PKLRRSSGANQRAERRSLGGFLSIVLSGECKQQPDNENGECRAGRLGPTAEVVVGPLFLGIENQKGDVFVLAGKILIFRFHSPSSVKHCGQPKGYVREEQDDEETQGLQQDERQDCDENLLERIVL